MDQDPNTAGGTDTENMATGEPGQNTQTQTTASDTVQDRPNSIGEPEEQLDGMSEPQARIDNADNKMDNINMPESDDSSVVMTSDMAMSDTGDADETVRSDSVNMAVATSATDAVSDPQGQPEAQNQTQVQSQSQAQTESQARPQISEPAKAPYVKRDVRLPGDKAKRRTQIIIAAIVGGIILLLGGLAIWFFAYYNNPEKVMFDSVNNILHAPNVSLNGGGSITLRDAKDNLDGDVEMAILNFNSSSSKLPNATDVSLLVTFTGGKKVNLKLGTVQMSDGVIYLRIDGIIESLRDMGLDPDVQTEIEELFNLLETVDGEWWRISVPDIIKEVSGDDKISKAYGDIYNCYYQALAADHSKLLSSLYKQNKFIQVEPIKEISSGDGYLDYSPQMWHNLYEISIDSNSFANFLNSLPESEIAQELYTCYNNAVEEHDLGYSTMGSEDLAEISADDIEIPKELHLYAEISQFGHKIRSIWAYSEDDEWQNSFAVTLNYQASEISTPDNYRDITELFRSSVLQDIWISGPAPDYCTDDFGNNCLDGDPYAYDYDYDLILNSDGLEEIEWES